MRMAQRKNGDHPDSPSTFTTDTTFEMFHHHEQRPVTDAILEAYGQVGIPEDREEVEKEQSE